MNILRLDDDRPCLGKTSAWLSSTRQAVVLTSTCGI